jgi:hypothetical protein
MKTSMRLLVSVSWTLSIIMDKVQKPDTSNSAPSSKTFRDEV